MIAVVVLVAVCGAVWLHHTASRRAAEQGGCFEDPPGKASFTAGKPGRSATYVKPLSGVAYADLLDKARHWHGNAVLGPLRWAAAHRVVAPYVDEDMKSEGSYNFLTVRLARATHGEAVIMAPLRLTGDWFTAETHGAFTGALRISDGALLWTRVDRTTGASDSDQSALKAPATPGRCRTTGRPAPASPRYTYRVAGSGTNAPEGERNGIEVRDHVTGKSVRTARFLPGENIQTDGGTTQIAVADGTLIAQIGNLTLAFDLPRGAG